MKDPVTGIMVAISPRDCLHQVSYRSGLSSTEVTNMTKNTIVPTRQKLISAPAGPPSCKAFPELTNNPGPMIPTALSVAKVFRGVIVQPTSNCNHLKMPRFQLTLERCLERVRQILLIILTRSTSIIDTIRVRTFGGGSVCDSITIALVCHSR